MVQHFVVNNVIVDAIKKWTATAGKEFYQHWIQAFVCPWKECFENSGKYIENNS